VFIHAPLRHEIHSELNSSEILPLKGREPHFHLLLIPSAYQPTFTTRLRGPLWIISEISAAYLTAFTPCFPGSFCILGKVAGTTTSFTHVASGLGYVALKTLACSQLLMKRSGKDLLQPNQIRVNKRGAKFHSKLNNLTSLARYKISPYLMQKKTRLGGRKTLQVGIPVKVQSSV